MSNQTIELTDELYAYLLSNSLRETDILQRLRTETATLEMARMQIAPEQGQFMGLLTRLLGARKYLEVGTFTGYSALVCALSMPPDAKLYALDVSEEWTDIARRYWEEAGVAERIELHLDNALVTLPRICSGEAGQIDMIFIDADKTAYADYVEFAWELLRPGGLLAIDNTLWGGAVADPADNDPDTIAIRAVNAAMHRDERFDISLVPIGDGLTLARKR